MAVKHRWVSTDGDMANPSSWLDGTAPATKAVGVLVFADVALNNETVTIDAKVYTFQTTLTDVDGNVYRGTSAADSNNNLIAAITLGVGAGTLYANSMTLHPSVTATAQSSDTMDAMAKLRGTDGNSIATTEAVASADWDDITLLGATQWATDDEIAVDMEATQDFLTNLDWSTTFCSPELRLVRFNIDRTNIAFGASGNPIKLSLASVGALNYLGTGLMYADFKGPLDVYVNSLTSQQVLSLNIRTDGLRFMIVHSGKAVIVAGAVVASVTFRSEIYTTGSAAKLVIGGVNEIGPDFLVVYAGEIENQRTVDDTWVIVGMEGAHIQKGLLGTPTILGGVLNLGGLFSYEPITDPVTFSSLEGRHIAGLSRFDLSNYEIVVGGVLQGADAILKRGPMIALGTPDVDLADDFPF